MNSFLFIFLVIVSFTLAQDFKAFRYYDTNSMTLEKSSQDVDLINYDSAQCSCDITYLRDYDCSCDPDTQTNQKNYFTTSRKTTLEQNYMLLNYPLCDTLRHDIEEIIPSYINNIACLSRVNKAYSGYFYNSQEDTTASRISINLSTSNYNVTSFLLFQKSDASVISNPTQLSSTNLQYAPDFFGFCRIVPIIKPDIINYSTDCQQQKGSLNQIQITLVQEKAEYGIGNLINSNFSFQIGVQSQQRIQEITNISFKDQGYSYGNYLNLAADNNVLQNTIKFGGIFYLTTTQLEMQTLKVDSTAKTTKCSGLIDGQQYIIYYTDIGSKDSSTFQIVNCLAKTIQTQQKPPNGQYLYSFDFLSSEGIIDEQSYTDRLQKYVYRLFYPLYSFLSGSKLSLAVATILSLFTIILF